jgi:hypothetical protein
LLDRDSINSIDDYLPPTLRSVEMLENFPRHYLYRSLCRSRLLPTLLVRLRIGIANWPLDFEFPLLPNMVNLHLEPGSSVFWCTSVVRNLVISLSQMSFLRYFSSEDILFDETVQNSKISLYRLTISRANSYFHNIQALFLHDLQRLKHLDFDSLAFDPTSSFRLIHSQPYSLYLHQNTKYPDISISPNVLFSFCGLTMLCLYCETPDIWDQATNPNDNIFRHLKYLAFIGLGTYIRPLFDVEGLNSVIEKERLPSLKGLMLSFSVNLSTLIQTCRKKGIEVVNIEPPVYKQPLSIYEYEKWVQWTEAELGDDFLFENRSKTLRDMYAHVIR